MEQLSVGNDVFQLSPNDMQIFKLALRDYEAQMKLQDSHSLNYHNEFCWALAPPTTTEGQTFQVQLGTEAPWKITCANEKPKKMFLANAKLLEMLRAKRAEPETEDNIDAKEHDELWKEWWKKYGEQEKRKRDDWRHNSKYEDERLEYEAEAAKRMQRFKEKDARRALMDAAKQFFSSFAFDLYKHTELSRKVAEKNENLRWVQDFDDLFLPGNENGIFKVDDGVDDEYFYVSTPFGLQQARMKAEHEAAENSRSSASTPTSY